MVYIYESNICDIFNKMWHKIQKTEFFKFFYLQSHEKVLWYILYESVYSFSQIIIIGGIFNGQKIQNDGR